MGVTMKDVAALAGVGVGTVSRMINDVAVKASTRKKVEAAIKELNFEPDASARALKTKRSQASQETSKAAAALRILNYNGDIEID